MTSNHDYTIHTRALASFPGSPHAGTKNEGRRNGGRLYRGLWIPSLYLYIYKYIYIYIHIYIGTRVSTGIRHFICHVIFVLS